MPRVTAKKKLTIILSLIAFVITSIIIGRAVVANIIEKKIKACGKKNHRAM